MFLKYPFHVIKYSYKRAMNSRTKPVFINFLLTYLCNARCVMCNIWNRYRENPDMDKEELTLGHIEKFIIDEDLQ